MFDIINNFEANMNQMNDNLKAIAKLPNNELSAKKCESCGSRDIENEAGSQVCVHCGQVLRDVIQFQAEPSQLSVNCHQFCHRISLPNCIRNNQTGDRLPASKRMGLETVKNLSSQFSLERDVRNEALGIWQTTSAHHSFSCTSTQTKQVLAAVCVYVALMRNNRPVAIGHVCNGIDCSTVEFGKVYTQVVKDFPHLKPDSTPIEHLVPVTLSEAQFDADERNKLQDRVIEMLCLERDCWLIEGRSPVHIIFGASYLAWKSLKTRERAKVKLTDYCSRVGIAYKHTTSERVIELFNALKKLASNLPGKQNFKFTKNNIALYIEEILNYKHSLMYDLNRQMRDNSEKTSHDTPNQSLEWMNTFKRKAAQSKSKESAQTNESELNINTDDDISDSEINSYIRDQSEVKIIKKLKKLVDDDDDEDSNRQ